MIFDKYPYTNFHEMNDDWIIQTMRMMDEKLDEFVTMNTLTYADPIAYDPAVTYAANTVVIYNETAYVSKQSIPAGMLPTVGGDYWLEIFPFGAMFENYSSSTYDILSARVNAALDAAAVQLNSAIGTIPDVVTQWLTDNPNIVTSVQPHSISYQKLNRGLQNSLLVGYVKEDVVALESADFEQGGIYGTDGTDMESVNACRTGYITFEKACIVRIICLGGYRFYVYEYDGDETYLGLQTDAIAPLDTVFAADPTHKYRFSIFTDPVAPQTPSDLPYGVIMYEPYVPEETPVDELANTVIESTNKYPIAIGLWRQGTINVNTGSLPASSYACRTSNTISFTQSGFVKIVVPVGFKLACNEYINAAGLQADFNANLFDLKTGTFNVYVKSDKFYRFAISKIDNTELLLADLPQLPITVEFMQICDKLLNSVYSRKFNQDDLETGRYGITTASPLSSAVSVRDGSWKQYTVLGVRSSINKHKGILDNCDHLKTRGNIYMYAIGIDSTDGSVKGWYKSGIWSTDANIIITNELNISEIKTSGVSVQVCFVDISLTTQLAITDAIEYIDVYYTPERTALADVCVEPQHYYEQMLADKSNDILSAMKTAGRNSFTFMYFTDPHWSNNAKQTPALMKYISDNLGIDDVICGGDIIAGQGVVEYATSEILGCLRAFKNVGITFPISCGNHDRNWNTDQNQHDYPERRLSDSAVWALMESWYNKPASYFTASGFNFYIDFEKSNTRAIFIDTGDDNTYSEWNAFAYALMAAGDKNIVVFPHAVYINDIGNYICAVCNSYNARQQHISDYLNYDFTNAQGHVYIVIGGHGHTDRVVTPVAGGISFVMCDTNSLNTNSEAGSKIGTVTEQAFDVVTIDYNTGITNFTRIGRGSDREV